jgi:hypothetical protein
MGPAHRHPRRCRGAGLRRDSVWYTSASISMPTPVIWPSQSRCFQPLRAPPCSATSRRCRCR